MPKANSFSDQDILMRIRQGEMKMLSILYDRNRKNIRSLIRKNNGSDADADDVLQEAIIVVWQQVQNKEFKLSAKMDTYIFSIAKNLWLKSLRKNKRMQSEGDWNTFESEATNSEIENENTAIIAKYVNMLSDACRDILQLFYFDGLEMDEIALRLNFANADTVKAKKYQCKKKLEDLIKRDYLKEDLI